MLSLPTPNGRRFCQCYNPAPRKFVSAQAAIAAAFLKPSSGFFVPEHNGDFFPNHTVNGIAVYKRFAMWSRLGIFEKLFEHFAAERDLEYLLIDSTIVRAHACAAGAKKKRVNSH